MGKLNGKSQCERIVEYMEHFGSITSAEAFSDLGCARLASRINDLRKRGFNIIGRYESGKNRFGDSTRYMRYSIAGQKKEGAEFDGKAIS